MGQVFVPVTITNFFDVIRARDGAIGPEAVRRVSLENVLVDTGAVHLALPADLVAQLGLELVSETPIVTANGRTRARVFRGATLNVMGREGDFRCLELPVGTPVLLGAVPMEELGLEPDLRNRTLRLLPETDEDTYHLML